MLLSNNPSWNESYFASNSISFAIHWQQLNTNSLCSSKNITIWAIITGRWRRMGGKLESKFHTSRVKIIFICWFTHFILYVNDKLIFTNFLVNLYRMLSFFSYLTVDSFVCHSMTISIRTDHPINIIWKCCLLYVYISFWYYKYSYVHLFIIRVNYGKQTI